MVTTYLVVKFVHVLTAILALGSSAGLGLLLEFWGSDPIHGAFVLRAIKRIEALLVMPGYVLMLITGLWMVAIAWPITTHWLEAALALWVVGLLLLGAYHPLLARQIRLAETGGRATPAYAKLSAVGRILGGGGGFVIVLILWLMVTKPSLPWW